MNANNELNENWSEWTSGTITEQEAMDKLLGMSSQDLINVSLGEAPKDDPMSVLRGKTAPYIPNEPIETPTVDTGKGEPVKEPVKPSNEPTGNPTVERPTHVPENIPQTGYEAAKLQIKVINYFIAVPASLVASEAMAKYKLTDEDEAELLSLYMLIPESERPKLIEDPKTMFYAAILMMASARLVPAISIGWQKIKTGDHDIVSPFWKPKPKSQLEIQEKENHPIEANSPDYHESTVQPKDEGFIEPTQPQTEAKKQKAKKAVEKPEPKAPLNQIEIFDSGTIKPSAKASPNGFKKTELNRKNFGINSVGEYLYDLDGKLKQSGRKEKASAKVIEMKVANKNDFEIKAAIKEAFKVK